VRGHPVGATHDDGAKCAFRADGTRYLVVQDGRVVDLEILVHDDVWKAGAQASTIEDLDTAEPAV
jgi:hypothetical protein